MKEFKKFMSKHCLSCFLNDTRLKDEDYCESCAHNMSEIWRAALECMLNSGSCHGDERFDLRRDIIVAIEEELEGTKT